MSENRAIRAMNLTKYYGDFLAVDHLDFEVHVGEVFGFLGPNGAGKTTTVRMLTTLVEPTEGSVLINGYDVSRQPYQAKRQFGSVPEESSVYTEISTWENLMFTARLYRVPRKEREMRTEQLLELMGLENKRDERALTLSKGMRQRLSLAMALIHRPEVLFLDEPALGLDVYSAELIKERVRQLNEDGTTIFLTTHQIEMADQLCDRVAIIHEGKLVAIERPETLKQAFEGSRSVRVSLEKGEPAHWAGLAALPGVTGADRSKEEARLFTSDPPMVLAEVMAYVQENGLRVTALNTEGPSLEDVFLSITGIGLGPERHRFRPDQCRNCPMHDQCSEDDEQEHRGPPRPQGILKSACGH